MRLFYCPQPGLLHLMSMEKKGGEKQCPKVESNGLMSKRDLDSFPRMMARIYSCTSHPLSKKGFKVLNEGDEVEFEIAQGKKGLQAIDVVKC